MRGIWAAVAIGGLSSVAAHAGGQAGAPVAAPMQQGAWGSGGWQPGAVPSAPSHQPTADAGAPIPAAQGAPAAPAYSAPPPPRGRFKPIAPGRKLPGGYADPIYTVYDWRAYGLQTPYPGTRWVRYFDDAVLADGHGRAIVVRPVAWDAPRARRAAPRSFAGYTPPVASTRTVRTGPNTTVTTQVIPPPPGYYPGGYGPDYGWGPGVTVTPSVVTTTTTRYEPIAARSTRRGR